MKRALNSGLFKLLGWLKDNGKATRTMSEVFKFWYDIPVDPVHYYSPLPDVSKIRRSQSRWRQASHLPGVKTDLSAQEAFVNQLQPFAREVSELPSINEVSRLGYGLGYGEMEAQFLHCMIRHFKPSKIIEVGSGVSTLFSLNAMGMNAKEYHTHCRMACIEPFPSLKIKELSETNQISLQIAEVQDVSPEFFQGLKENDILFIDSTHAGKLDSDVFHLYLEVLPRLNRGVVIHIHDISFPFLTCPPEHPVFPLSVLWNETALCQAFLAFNNSFEIIMCQSFLHHNKPSVIGNLFNGYDAKKHFPSSLWLKKIA
jgi:predicted O-methyltransferase YrrM